MEASIYRLRRVDILTVCVLALLTLGVVMVQSASTSLSGSIVRATPPPEDAPRKPGPEALSGLTAAVSPNGIDLSWAYAADPAVTGYRIERAPNAAGPFETVEIVRKPASSYRDSSASTNTPSAYRVAAMDDLGRFGPPAVLTATRPGKWMWNPLGTKHLTFAIISLAAYLLVSRIDYRKFAGRAGGSVLKSPVMWAVAIAALLCVGVLVPGVGSAVNGARRWIKVGPIQLQPSELAKWAAVLFTAWWLTRPDVRMERFFRGFLPALVPVGALCLLVVIQDFGTAALIALCALTMMLAGRVKLTHLAIVLIPALLMGYWFIAHKEYRLRRIMAFRDPYASPQGEGYHMIQSLLSFSTGGIFGRGLGNGIQKLGYLPEDTTDFIFAVICEELGLFGAMLVIALYLGLLYVAWQMVKSKRDDFGRMLAFGIGSMIGLQAAINIAVATVSVPTKGLSLPLISAGGTGLIITCAALGMLASVARVRKQPTPAVRVEPEASPDVGQLQAA